MLFLIASATVVATFLGGLFALRFKDKLHLILGFSAGAVIGVALFDLLPEAFSLAGKNTDLSFITALIALGFVLYMFVDRFLSIHSHGEDCDNHSHKGILGAGSFSLHSLLDGVAIGLAFQVSSAVGLIVALAVLAHDFSDGINTVSVIIKNGGKKSTAMKWLSLDALAPALGIFLSSFFTISENSLGLLLSLFCGFFLYIGASDLLPESHHAHPTYWTTFMTILGVLVLYCAVSLAGI